MDSGILFQIQIVVGYVVWFACFRTFILPKLLSMRRIDAQRAIAALHSFRFFGLAFIVPGVVGPSLPAGFAQFAAYGDFATGLLALAALLAVRVRSLFWGLVVAFNVVGLGDLLFNYYHAVQADLPHFAGQLGGTYAVPIVYVPLLMITHVTSVAWLVRDALSNLRAGDSPALGRSS